MSSCFPLFALVMLSGLSCPQFAAAQQTPNPATQPANPARTEKRMLAGSVQDELGNPLKGATVMVVGDHLHAVSTNSTGDYLLPVTTAAPLVRVSFAGYKDVEQVVKGPADQQFMLEPVANYRKDLKKRTRAATKAWKH